MGAGAVSSGTVRSGVVSVSVPAGVSSSPPQLLRSAKATHATARKGPLTAGRCPLALEGGETAPAVRAVVQILLGELLE